MQYMNSVWEKMQSALDVKGNGVFVLTLTF